MRKRYLIKLKNGSFIGIDAAKHEFVLVNDINKAYKFGSIENAKELVKELGLTQVQAVETN